jgi:hypothetical protein
MYGRWRMWQSRAEINFKMFKKLIVGKTVGCPLTQEEKEQIRK